MTYRNLTVGFLAEVFGGGDYPEWVRDLAGKSGVYLIKDRESGRLLYVGESHSGRLKKTLLRHFQAWTGRTAGKKYDRGAVAVAVIMTTPAAAVARQDALILSLRPRDNETGARPDPATENEGDPF